MTLQLLQTEIDADEARLTALENRGVSPNESQAVHDFHAGLEEEHTADTVLYVAPYNSVTRLILSNPKSIAGDSDGITETSTGGRLEYSGFSDDIHKVIALRTASVPSGRQMT